MSLFAGNDHEYDDASTGEAFAYFGVWLLGFVAPFSVAGWAWNAGLEVGGRLLAVGGTVAVFDAILIHAGVTGRGPALIVQPWSWGRYALWLGGRAFLFAIAVF
ncbi:MAG: hypothetical protein JJT89_15525 [Nitriliruptoraceae bacterium]|nr:hypothetical protein [Nitriliruptoraceae bacterium]